jgi:hypothetical protein
LTSTWLQDAVWHALDNTRLLQRDCDTHLLLLLLLDALGSQF